MHMEHTQGAGGTPAGFVQRKWKLLTGLAAVSLMVGVLGGCNGGGSGGVQNATATPTGTLTATPTGTLTPSPTPIGTITNVDPVLTPLAVLTPLPIATGVANFNQSTGAAPGDGATIVDFTPTGPLKAGGVSTLENRATVINPKNAVDQIVTFEKLVIANFGSQPNNTGTPTVSNPLYRTAAELRFTQADLDRYKQILLSNRLVAKGDTLGGLNFTKSGRTFQTVAVYVGNTDTLRFNCVLSSVPARSEEQTAYGTSKAVSVLSNRNIYDGHTHYSVELDTVFKYNSSNDVVVTSATSKVTRLGYFMTVLTGPSIPTTTAASPVTAKSAGECCNTTSVKAAGDLAPRDPKKCQQTQSTTGFAWDNRRDSQLSKPDSRHDDSFSKSEINRLKVCGKTNTTGGGGGTG